ncbi:hypothetical protein EDD40_1703 [Saccharothrix texasensis]|uniref:Uncharacterized protein n=1 Tax=Saccharothrix texasensis TaxID=103734 RepID=A0A3N1H1N2_9PSEU|nr:hypothetical protein EDD40_1703 [Saccharothrix texasensis]
MTLAGLAKPATEGFSPRFVVVGYLPSFAAAVFLLLLVWAGAPGPLTWSHAWETAAALGVGEAVVLAVALTLLAVALMPLQLTVARPAGPAAAGGAAVAAGQARAPGRAARRRRTHARAGPRRRPRGHAARTALPRRGARARDDAGQRAGRRRTAGGRELRLGRGRRVAPPVSRAHRPGAGRGGRPARQPRQHHPARADGPAHRRRVRRPAGPQRLVVPARPGSARCRRALLHRRGAGRHRLRRVDHRGVRPGPLRAADRPAPAAAVDQVRGHHLAEGLCLQWRQGVPLPVDYVHGDEA